VKFPLIDVAVHGGVVEGTHTVELRATVSVKGVERAVDLATTVTVLDDGAVRIVAHAGFDRHEFGVDGNLLGMVGRTARISVDAVFAPLAVPSP
jgi:polyisoprenoid-binding protein YceI